MEKTGIGVWKTRGISFCQICKHPAMPISGVVVICRLGFGIVNLSTEYDIFCGHWLQTYER